MYNVLEKLRKKITINYLQCLYEKLFINPERISKWKYDKERMKMDKVLDAIDITITAIETNN